MNSNASGNDINKINKYLDEYGVLRHHPGNDKAGLTTWGRISLIINERDQLRAEVKRLQDELTEVTNERDEFRSEIDELRSGLE